MKLEIRTYPDDVLAEPCKPVKKITPEIRKLIENMVETMYADDGVGLAAPQVGQPIRLITVDRTGPKERADLRVIINPEIVEREGEVDSQEACLSCPGFQAKIKRSERVRVTGMDADGARTCALRRKSCWPSSCNTRSTIWTARPLWTAPAVSSGPCTRRK